MTNNFDRYEDEPQDAESNFAEQMSNVIRSARNPSHSSEVVETPASVETPPIAVTQYQEADEHAESESPDEDFRYVSSAATSDPAFGYVIGVAVAIGLAPLIGSGQPDLRYTLCWMVLALFGVLAWLFGNVTRIDTEAPEDIIWGIVFGLILGVPLYAFGSQTLATAVDLLFGTMSTGTTLAYLVFVIPLAETLFFRGVMQENRQFWMIGLISALWSVIIFFPMLDVSRYAVVGVVISAVLLMMNMIYSYVRQRNGLAAAWVCQIVANLMIVFLPMVSG